MSDTRLAVFSAIAFGLTGGFQTDSTPVTDASPAAAIDEETGGFADRPEIRGDDLDASGLVGERLDGLTAEDLLPDGSS